MVVMIVYGLAPEFLHKNNAQYQTILMRVIMKVIVW